MRNLANFSDVSDFETLKISNDFFFRVFSSSAVNVGIFFFLIFPRSWKSSKHLLGGRERENERIICRAKLFFDAWRSANIGTISSWPRIFRGGNKTVKKRSKRWTIYPRHFQHFEIPPFRDLLDTPFPLSVSWKTSLVIYFPNAK